MSGIPGDEPRSTGVLMASAVLVLGVWGALELAPPAAPTSTDPGAAGSGASMPEVDGFRSDAWYLPDDSRLGFVEIPGGPFTMGSDPAVDPLAFDVEWWGDGRVQGTVDLPTFYLARYEVTVAQFSAYLVESGAPLADPRSIEAPPAHPVAWVSWTDAVAYARWLDRALHEAASDPTRRPRIPEELTALLGAGWRVALPTEAQWEKAARSPDARIYPWGNEPRRDRANFGARTVADVGRFACPECAYGLLDMSGNVWEWTRSPYQPYPYSDTDDADAVSTDALWAMRGGSFGDTEQFVRAANRGGGDPGARRPFIGFRVALVRD